MSRASERCLSGILRIVRSDLAITGILVILGIVLYVAITSIMLWVGCPRDDLGTPFLRSVRRPWMSKESTGQKALITTANTCGPCIPTSTQLPAIRTTTRARPPSGTGDILAHQIIIVAVVTSGAVNLPEVLLQHYSYAWGRVAR
jgi:hypothetical protein